MYIVVAILYPYVNSSSGCFKIRSIYATGCVNHDSGISGIFDGRGYGRACVVRGVQVIGGQDQEYCGGGSGAY